MSTRRVLVAGGAGYIGSHTAVCLIEAGYSVTIADNFVNSSAESIARVRELTGASEVVLNVVNVDLCNASELDRMFVEHGPFVACIHFAGLKAVGESVLKPLLYYENNLLSTTNLLSSLDKHGLLLSYSRLLRLFMEVHRFLFPSLFPLDWVLQIPMGGPNI